MTALARDPLLSFALVVVRLIAILLAVAVIAAVIGMVFFAYDASTGSGVLASEYPGSDPAVVSGHLWRLLPFAAVGMACAATFMHLLGKIIVSAAERDPFDAINAKRLHRMAWLALAFQIIAYPVRAAEAGLRAATEGGPVYADIGFGGFIIALVLFVLARIFAHGADMRDDLEGTV